MTTISKIQGVQDLRLTGQVVETTRPHSDGQLPASQDGGQRLANDSTVGQSPVKSLNGNPPEFDVNRLQKVADELQTIIDAGSGNTHGVSFRRDPVSHQYVIEIRNPHGEVIKQFPPEKVLNMQHRLDDLSGMIIDKMI